MKTKTIKKGDIIQAAIKASINGEMAELTSESPALMLIMPILGMEIENIIFAETEKED